MKKILIIILFTFVFTPNALALEIVYPKKNPVQINASSTFFIGSAKPNEVIKINDIEVKASPIGAFAQSVPLTIGENNFKLISGRDVIDFVIVRPQPKAISAQKPELIEYPYITFLVKNDNAPLRMTPVDSGINRLSHLPTGTELIVNGEKGNFYRVYLNSNLSGWIGKNDVVGYTPHLNPRELPLTPTLSRKGRGRTAKFNLNSQGERENTFKLLENNEFCLYEFELDKKIPFALKEENGLNLELFNINDSQQQQTSNDTYCLNFPMQKLFGYDAYYEDNKFILKIRKQPEISSTHPLKNIKIAIDAGHGGKESGAIGCCGDKEKDINLAIAKNLREQLDSRGAKVVMTREEDIDLSLKDRVKIAKETDSTILISIHANAIPDGNDPQKNRGTSVYYYHPQAKPLAENILASMTTQLGTQNDKVRQGSLALVRPTSSVSVLIEVAYIINPDDYALLLDKSFQARCAKAIADGIENYLKD